MRPTNENKHKKGAQLGTPKKENNAEWGEGFILEQTHFIVNNNMQ
jgi:hypothetical protein